MTLEESLALAEKHYLSKADPPRDPVENCEICGEELYEGDDAYEILGKVYCVHCIEDCEINL